MTVRSRKHVMDWLSGSKEAGRDVVNRKRRGFKGRLLVSGFRSAWPALVTGRDYFIVSVSASASDMPDFLSPDWSAPPFYLCLCFRLPSLFLIHECNSRSMRLPDSRLEILFVT